MFMIRLERYAGSVERTENQRRLGEVNAIIRQPADARERRHVGTFAVHGAAARRGSSRMITWLTTCLTSSIRRAWSTTLSSSA